MNTKPFLMTALLSISILSPLGAEVPYLPGSGWKTFTFYNPGFGNYENAEGEFAFTVYAGQNAVLTVTDGGWNNEKFEIYNKGNWTGWTTSNPSSAGQHWTTSFDVAAESPNWSSGSWILLPGTYKLTFGIGQWNPVKTDVNGSNVYRGAFKVSVVQTPDADNDKIADQFETGTGIYVSPVNTGTDPNKFDSDGDGLDDWTEISVRATDPNKADTDGDGFWDLAEIQAGKSPRNASDNPDAAMEVRTAVEVTLYTKVGTNYQVEWSEDLSAWTPLPEIIVGDGNPVTKFYSTREHPRRYFRAAKMITP
jgi:hypothetical protein